MIELIGKPIAITGASSGIGRAVAVAAAKAGMPVALAARRTDRLESAAAEIRAAGGRAIAVKVNVDNPDECRALIQRTIAEFGSVYSVFANAGYGFEKPIHEATDAEIRGIFETNFFGTLNTVRPALEPMLQARSGHILICSSCLSKLGLPGFGAYCATKASQDHVSRAMRAELSPFGIAVSSVHPIGTRTEFFEKADALSGEGASTLHTPDYLTQSPERVARAIMRNLRSGRGTEVWTSLGIRAGLILANMAPRLTDAIFSRHVSKATRQRR